jgi:Insertion element 4 transposase N-terminal/Transposase DDE domain
MPRPSAALPASPRLTDHISLGVIARTFPPDRIQSILATTGTASRRQRELPAHVVVYYSIALALYMSVSTREVLRSLLEGLRWLWGAERVTVASKSGISQARTRLGEQPLQQLYVQVVQPVATGTTRGAWYRDWRLVSLDGSCLDVADTAGNVDAFGRPPASRGVSAFPQLRFVALVENGTHVLFGAHLGGYADSELTIAHQVVPALKKGMLCLADRYYVGYELWQQAAAGGADLLWRARTNARLDRDQVLPDGSYLSRIYASTSDRRNQRRGIVVRAIDYQLDGVEGAEPIYRLVTTILDPKTAPAEELAALYHERWEIEGALDELKTHLRGARIVLRSKTPTLVKQEFWGLLLAHYAVRGLMHEAALQADEDPDRLSFLHAVRVVRRKLPLYAAFSPSEARHPACGGAQRDLGRTGGEQPWTAGAARGQAQDEQLSVTPPRVGIDSTHPLSDGHPGS